MPGPGLICMSLKSSRKEVYLLSEWHYILSGQFCPACAQTGMKFCFATPSARYPDHGPSKAASRRMLTLSSTPLQLVSAIADASKHLVNAVMVVTCCGYCDRLCKSDCQPVPLHTYRLQSCDLLVLVWSQQCLHLCETRSCGQQACKESANTCARLPGHL